MSFQFSACSLVLIVQCNYNKCNLSRKQYVSYFSNIFLFYHGQGLYHICIHFSVVLMIISADLIGMSSNIMKAYLPAGGIIPLQSNGNMSGSGFYNGTDPRLVGVQYTKKQNQMVNTNTFCDIISNMT